MDGNKRVEDGIRAITEGEFEPFALNPPKDPPPPDEPVTIPPYKSTVDDDKVIDAKDAHNNTSENVYVSTPAQAAELVPDLARAEQQTEPAPYSEVTVPEEPVYPSLASFGE